MMQTRCWKTRNRSVYLPLLGWTHGGIRTGGKDETLEDAQNIQSSQVNCKEAQINVVTVSDEKVYRVYMHFTPRDEISFRDEHILFREHLNSYSQMTTHRNETEPGASLHLRVSLRAKHLNPVSWVMLRPSRSTSSYPQTSVIYM